MESPFRLLPEAVPETLSRAVALRFVPDSLVQGGTGLNLSILPSASASLRNLDPSQSVHAVATALGLGFGESRFYADPSNDSFFTSRRLTVLTGGGTIDGSATATSTALGVSQPAAEATAINVAIANTTLLSRGGDPLWIGSAAHPFLAMATAAGHALQPAGDQGDAGAALVATARVRGLEGSPAADLSPVPQFAGQPNAVVEAVARLKSAEGSGVNAGSSALADAKGLEGYAVLALPAASGPSQVGGMATARLALPEGMAPLSPGPLLSAEAIGIDHSTILGPASGALRVVGGGQAWLDPSDAAVARLAPPDGAGGGPGAAALLGLGIHASTVMANGGDAQVFGMADAGLTPQAAPTASVAAAFPLDAAGIDRSSILTGRGNDLVEGISLVKGSFDGIRNSTVNTGAGRDVIQGSANASLLDAGGDDDTILLSRSRDSRLEGGFGSDNLSVGMGSRGNHLDGGFGNDTLQVQGGSLNRLDGGFGQDQLSARDGGGDTFVQSEAGAALRAADSRAFAEQLTDPGFWSTLAPAARQAIWSSGEWKAEAAAAGSRFVGGQVDVINGFDPNRGDKLELSSSLAGITQDLWDRQGVLYTVENGHLVGPDGATGAPTPQPVGGIGVVVGSLSAIRSLGVGAPTIAYATDTHQLMYDADGDWSGGSLSIGSVSLANPGASLHKADLRFNA